jgi:hypothetical protein
VQRARGGPGAGKKRDYTAIFPIMRGFASSL